MGYVRIVDERACLKRGRRFFEHSASASRAGVRRRITVTASIPAFCLRVRLHFFLPDTGGKL